MRKLVYLIVCCLFGICNLSAQTIEGENILLTYVFTFSPMDNSEHNTGDGRPDSNRFGATINGKDLSVKARTDLPARVEIRKANGTIIVKQDFINETDIIVPTTGDYTIRISSSNTIVEGSFTAK